MLDFEAGLRVEPRTCSSLSLKELASGLTDVYDAKLDGWCDGKMVVEIVGFDSSRWEVSVDEQAGEFR